MEVQIDQENVKRMKRSYRNKKRKKKVKTVTLLILLIIIVVGIVFFMHRKNVDVPNSSVDEKEIIATLVGKWTTDGNTIYEFNEDGSGTLIVPVANLPFTYKFENNQLFIDFENEDSDDTFYTYEVTDTKLILTSINGTFEFIRCID